VQFFRSRHRRSLAVAVPVFVALVATALALPLRNRSAALAAAGSAACPNDDSGLQLPPGFCATIFADGIGHARHMAVTPAGVVYVNTWSGQYYGNDNPHAGEFLVALQATAGKDPGKADVQDRFGESAQSGGHAGTGIGLYNGSLYAEINDRIVRYMLAAGSPGGSIVPQGAPVTIVSGLPLTGDHPMHPFIIDAQGSLYVDVASATNSCQLKNRTLQSPSAEPCTSLRLGAGSGAMTPINPTSNFQAPSASPPGSATAKDSRLTRPAACSSRNTAATNCIRIGRLSLSPSRRPPNPPKKCYF
jgi:glucose/arabinose dehydrogenase